MYHNAKIACKKKKKKKKKNFWFIIWWSVRYGSPENCVLCHQLGIYGKNILAELLKKKEKKKKKKKEIFEHLGFPKFPKESFVERIKLCYHIFS